jgi:hypothetical protein
LRLESRFLLAVRGRTELRLAHATAQRGSRSGRTGAGFGSRTRSRRRNRPADTGAGRHDAGHAEVATGAAARREQRLLHRDGYGAR